MSDMSKSDGDDVTSPPPCKKAREEVASSEPQPGKSGETSSCEQDDEAVTMVDVLKDSEALEADAQAVLGAADHQNCTYFSQGYSPRQALYACLTCCPPKSPDFKPTGVCLACSYHCHEGHEIVELYTKRKFRCDCGNGLYSKDFLCKLEPNKAKVNDDNTYNQNFSGVYCTCHRPYPDPEDPIEDEMIQCVVCEDWYHGRHLGIEKDQLPGDNAYAEMICLGCVEQHAFLLAYAGYSVTKTSKADGDVSVDNANDSINSSSMDDSVLNASTVTLCGSISSSVDNPPTKPADEDAKSKCTIAAFQEDSIAPKTLFMLDGWRKAICRCTACQDRFQEKKLSFLRELEDTVHHYEAKSKEKAGSQYEEGLKALSEMDRVKQVEAIQSYNAMKTGLMNYFKSFAEGNKVVKEEDVKKFFENMKQQQANSGRLEMPKFCK